MTFLDKAIEMGETVSETMDGKYISQKCPADLKLESKEATSAFCKLGMGCVRCWGRPYSGDDQRHFDTGAVRDSATGKGRYDLLPWGAIHALAQHCERGAIHYGERNVDKGIPQHSFMDSAIRHISQYIQGDAEQHHLVAALWNIAWACEQEIKRPQMIDLPERTDASGNAV